MTPLSPCPICGNDRPVIDTGPSDAPFDRPFIHCPTVHPVLGGFDEACPMHAQGAAAWEHFADLVRQRYAPDAPQIVGERPVQCQSCDTRIVLPVSPLGVASIRGLDGWRFNTDTGWQCPKHHAGSADA